MINPNKFANQKIQELGKSLFQGEEMAQQMANKQLDQPVPPPGPYGDMNPIMNKESREARRQERKNIRMANKALRSSRRERAKGVKEQGQENYSYDGYEKGRYNKKGDDIEYGKVKRYSKKNPPDGSDASFGISGYVNDKKQFKSALNQNDPPLKPIKDPSSPKPTPVVPEKLPRQRAFRSVGERLVKQRPIEPVREAPSPPSRIPEQVPQKIAPFNFDDPKSKYKTVNVQDLEDMGRVKSDKKGKYVVNSDEMKTGTTRDTLRLPRGAKHYTGRDYKIGEMIDESDFEDFAKYVNKT